MTNTPVASGVAESGDPSASPLCPFDILVRHSVRDFEDVAAAIVSSPESIMSVQRELARAVVHAAGLFNHTRSTLDFVHAAASVHDVDNLIDSRRRSGTGRKSHLLLCRAKT